MEVLDEPLYGHFLRVTGLDRPYRDAVLTDMVCVWYSKNLDSHVYFFYFVIHNIQKLNFCPEASLLLRNLVLTLFQKLRGFMHLTS